MFEMEIRDNTFDSDELPMLLKRYLYNYSHNNGNLKKTPSFPLNTNIKVVVAHPTTMAFFLQLRLLLWKNYTLKKRQPFIICLELIVPLVMFLILMSIRNHKPPMKSNEEIWFPQALPSAGVVPLLQSFCQGSYIVDRNGYKTYPNASINLLLADLVDVSNTPVFNALQDLRKLQNDFETFSKDNHFSKQRQIQNFNFSDVFKNDGEIRLFLQRNLSMPGNLINALMNATFNGSEISQILLERNSQLFDKYLHEIITDGSQHADSLKELQQSILFQALFDPTSLAHGPTWLRILVTAGQVPGISLNRTDDNKLKQFFIHEYLAKKNIRHMCSPDVFNKLLILSSKNISEKRTLQKFLCQLNSTQTEALLDEFKMSFNWTNLREMIYFNGPTMKDYHERAVKIQSDLTNMKNLEDAFIKLSKLSKDLRLNLTVIEQRRNQSQPHKVKQNINDIWTVLSPVLCGTEIHENLDSDGTLDGNNIQQIVKGKGDVLKYIYALSNDPMILYAPNGTQADEVMKKAGHLLELVKTTKEIGNQWLPMSSSFQNSLRSNSTQTFLKKMIKSVDDFPFLYEKYTNTDFDIYKQTPQKVKDFLIRNKDFFNPNSTKTHLKRILKSLTLSDNGDNAVLQQLQTVDYMANGWQAVLAPIKLDIFHGFPNETVMLQYISNVSTSKPFLSAVVFDNIKADGQLPKHVIYRIRMDGRIMPSTDAVRSLYWTPGAPANHLSYMAFAWIQDQIERALIDVLTGVNITYPGLYTQKLPYPCYLYDNFMFVVQYIMPLCVVVSFIYSVAILVQSIVYEKEQRLKEVMKMMGLSNAVHWTAWFITSAATMMVIVILLTVILKTGGILHNSNPAIILLFLSLAAMATTNFCFLMSIFFSKAKLAAACGGIIYFVTYMPFVFISVQEVGSNHVNIGFGFKTLASLLSTTALGLGARYFALFEQNGVGVQWDNIATSPIPEDHFNLAQVFTMLIVDTFLYAALVWYIEAVHPGTYGIPRPWYFPLQLTYWFGPNDQVNCELSCLTAYSRVGQSNTGAGSEPPNTPALLAVEGEPTHLTLGVFIDNLVKVYKKGSPPAVDHLSLNLYEGQITSFLGHNGAGKTTTMSLLSGLFPSTSGTAYIYGNDIHKDMDKIRRSLGLCPQHNVLYNRLTVEEHLWFYARLKGMAEKQVQEETNRILEDIGLPEKRSNKVDTLSGGMKRKLSVAMAFVGGSRTVILDEPTAGVDPFARRAIWELLAKYKDGRTILLSTHFMDEADILGDRIAIISHGKLRCCGTSLFLKTKFGDGYHLTIVRETSQDPSTTVSVETVTEFIKNFIPSAQLVCQSQYEISYILPDKGKEKKGELKKLFQSLDCNRKKLQCRSFGLQDTTLEEVFLKVTEAKIAGEDDVTNELTTTVDVPVSSSISSDTTAVNKTSNDSEILSTNASLTPLGSTSLNDTEMKTSHKTEKTFGHRRSFSTDYVHIKPAKSPKVIHRRTASGGYTCHRRAQSSDLTFLLTRNDTNSPGTIKKVSKHKRVPSGVAKIHSIGSEAWEMHAGGTTTVNGNMQRWQQFYGLLLKRLHHSRRNLKSLLTHILLPGIFVSIAMTVALSQPKADTYPPLVLSPTMFHPPPYYVPFSNNDRAGASALASKMERTLTFASGIGSDCVLKNSNIELNDFNVNDLQKNLSAYFDDFCKKQIDMSDHALLSSVKLFKSNYNQSRNWKNLTCQCVSPKMEYVCDPGIGSHVNMFNTVTMDTLVNVSNEDIMKYLLNTNFLYKRKRYGALIFGDQQTVVPTKVKNSSLPEIQRLFVRDTARAAYSNKGYHALPTFINVMNNAILRAYVEPNSNPAAYGITAITHPLNFTDNVLNLDSIKQGTDAIIAIFVIIAMSFVPASFVLFLVMERTTKAKHIQFVSGVNPVLYWLSNYLWDMLNFMVPAMACMVIFHAFNVPAYASRTNFPAVCALFVCYGWSITPMMYPASFVFREASTAYVVLILLNLFLGITCTVTTAILQLFLDDPQLRLAFEIVKTSSLIFPNYCLGRGLMELAYNELLNRVYGQIHQFDKIRSPFEWDIVLRSLVCMIVEGIIFFVITLIIEYKTSIRRKTVTVMEASSDGIDIDVVNEKQRVLSGGADDDLLRVENLTKIYNSKKTGKHLAVNCLTFGVAKGECFGLLGVNGAGKTTTFKMLTGDADITAGDAFIENSSVVRNLLQVHEKIGYCPQFDALFDHLTAEEHIYFYARLKGISELEIKKICNWLIKKMALTRYAKRPTKTYSGGNKRKLSAAIALIGNPSVIFMDEPTTGMDPGARRFLWNIILSIIHQGTRSVVLTSHSMEECEALCTRLAIMVNGQFQCLGSTQHIKDRFGDGYIVTVRVRGSLPNMAPVMDFMLDKFHNCVLKETHHNVAQYQIPSSANVSLASIFTQMELASQELDIEDYSISQTSLDNVFVNFAKYQTDNLLRNGPSFICAKKTSKLKSLQMKWKQLRSNFARTKADTSFTQLVQLPPDPFQESNEEDEDEVALHEIDSLSFPEETTRLTLNL